jgi:hypothetical protein
LTVHILQRNSAFLGESDFVVITSGAQTSVFSHLRVETRARLTNLNVMIGTLVLRHTQTIRYFHTTSVMAGAHDSLKILESTLRIRAFKHLPYNKLVSGHLTNEPHALPFRILLALIREKSDNGNVGGSSE